MLSQYVSNSLSLNRICCFKTTVEFLMAKNNKSKVNITNWDMPPNGKSALLY